MKRIIAATVLFVSCFSPLAFSGDDKCPASAQAIPLCTVLADAGRFDGKEVTVKGLYRMVIHGSVLMSPACSQTLVNMRRISGEKPNKQAETVIRSLTKKDQFHPVDVVLRGNFRTANEGQCFGQNCLSFEIEEIELLCAADVKPKS
jgi:hypothetical protein